MCRAVPLICPEDDPVSTYSSCTSHNKKFEQCTELHVEQQVYSLPYPVFRTHRQVHAERNNKVQVDTANGLLKNSLSWVELDEGTTSSAHSAAGNENIAMLCGTTVVVCC